MKHITLLAALLSGAALAYTPPPAGPIAWDWPLSATAAQLGSLNVRGLKLLDVDGFTATKEQVAKWKAQGIYTICYLDVGSWEPGRPDSHLYPSYLKIQRDPDWPSEFFLDIRDVKKPNSVLAGILRGRFEMCRAKGFDAVEPDNLQNHENVKGKKISLQDQLDFNAWVADAVHAAGMAVLQKNGPDLILLKDSRGRAMVDVFDGILNEQCQEYGECAALAEYTRRGKLVLDVEYKKNLTLKCSLAPNMLKRDLDLRAPGAKGYLRQSCP